MCEGRPAACLPPALHGARFRSLQHAVLSHLAAGACCLPAEIRSREPFRRNGRSRSPVTRNLWKALSKGPCPTRAKLRDPGRLRLPPFARPDGGAYGPVRDCSPGTCAARPPLFKRSDGRRMRLDCAATPLPPPAGPTAHHRPSRRGRRDPIFRDRLPVGPADAGFSAVHHRAALCPRLAKRWFSAHDQPLDGHGRAGTGRARSEPFGAHYHQPER
jgi:hypothetical protein